MAKKFDSKKYKDLRDFKSKEIKRSLVHRARLRKNYFKMMDGEKKEPQGDEGDEAIKEMRENRQRLTKSEYKDRSEPEYKERAKPEYKERVKPDYNERVKPDYNERARLVKERKENKRKEIMESINERKEKIDKANRQRERLRKKLERTTKSGQPLMGPRITHMLSKIKKSSNLNESR